MDSSDSSRMGNAGLGAVLIALGLVFLAAQLLGVNVWRFSWPLFIIVPGLAFFLGMIALGRAGGPLAIPGSIVTTVGLILLYQSTTGHWESWAYAWALIFPTAVGVGLFLQGAWSGHEGARRTGERMAQIGLVIFLGFALFFELVIGIGGLGSTAVAKIVGPSLLILLGLYLLVRRSMGWPGEGRTTR